MLFQCKAVAALPQWLQTSENVDATLIRVDGKGRHHPVQHKALIDLSFFLSLLSTTQAMEELLEDVP